MRYLDFDLSIERAAAGYRARIVNSPAGQAAFDFTLPFSEIELENFILRMGQVRSAVRRIESPQIEAAKAFGGKLFRAVFDDEVLRCLQGSLSAAEGQEAGVRIRLRLGEAPELAGLPWEYLYNPSTNRFLSLSVETPIVRFLDLPRSITPLAVQPPLRVLAVIANPAGLAVLDVEQEWARLQEALGDLERRRLLVLHRLESPTLAALQRTLRRQEYHILHFIGHGDFDADAQDGLLVFADAEGQSRAVGGQELGMMLYDEKTLRLAVLNACEGGRSSQDDPFAGVAQSLVQQGIPAVVAMQFAISDGAAVTFSHEFYSALADGYPVDSALAEARKALFTHSQGTEWGTPVLYMRASDGRIFDVEPASLLAADEETPILTPTPDPQAAPALASPRAQSVPPRQVRYVLPVVLVLLLLVVGVWQWPQLVKMVSGPAAGSPEALLAPTPTPAPTPMDAVMATTPQLPPSQVSDTTFFYTFAPAEDLWDAGSTQWQPIEVAPGQYAYQGSSDSDFLASTPPQSETMATWQNYLVEMEVRIVQPGIANDHFPDGWLTIRHDPYKQSGCTVTNIAYDVNDKEVSLSIGDAADCPYTVLASGETAFAPNTWYTIRVEAIDDHITVDVDGVRVIDASGVEPMQGFFFLNVGPGTVVQYANLGVTLLDVVQQ